MKLFCIADEDTVRGFRLAGIGGTVATAADDAARMVAKAAADASIGILILTDVVAATIRTLVDSIRLERDRPLIVEVPGPAGPMPGRKTLRRFVQEAVGVRMESVEER